MSDWKEKLGKLKLGLSKGGGASKKPEEAQPSSMRAAEVRRAQLRDFCIGLDFGTSATKAVVRLLPGGPAYAVPLGDRTGARCAYLAMTRLWIGPKGAMSLNDNGEGRWADDLKVRLMEEPFRAIQAQGLSDDARPVDLAAAYLALTLRRVFSWFEAKLRPGLGPVGVRWSMNLGIPVQNYDSEDVKSAFLAAARAAWRLARQSGAVDIGCAARVVEQAANDADTPAEEEIHVVPEVAAGVASYARSRLRRAGAHLFIDIGATTLDSSMFLLAEADDGLKYVFLSADVNSALGALRLHRHRADELRQLALACVDTSDPLAPIPQRARNCIPDDTQLSYIDETFTKKCVVNLGGVIYRAKLKAPNEISVRDDGPSEPINVMISGGGAFHRLYQEVIRRAGANAASGGGQGLRVRPFRVVTIPKVADLHPTDLSPEIWQRLAIAYGLSYRYDDIGEYVPPSAVPDFPRRQNAQGKRGPYIGKEQV